MRTAWPRAGVPCRAGPWAGVSRCTGPRAVATALVDACAAAVPAAGTDRPGRWAHGEIGRRRPCPHNDRAAGAARAPPRRDPIPADGWPVQVMITTLAVVCRPVHGQQVRAEVALRVTPDRVRVVGQPLGVVVLHQQPRSLQPVVAGTARA